MFDLDLTRKLVANISRVNNYLLEAAVYVVVRDVFGPKARTVSIDTEQEYNDEGGTYAYIQSMSVLDVNGDPVSPDFDNPWWDEVIKEFNKKTETDSWYKSKTKEEVIESVGGEDARTILKESLWWIEEVDECMRSITSLMDFTDRSQIELDLVSFEVRASPLSGVLEND